MLGLMTAQLDTSRYTTLNTELILSDMVVDDDKRLVFMLQRPINEQTSLMTMNIITSTFEQIHTFKTTAFSVVINAKRNICFIGMRDEVTSLNYNGKNVKVIHREQWIRQLTMDAENNVLYFLVEGNVKKMSLSDNVVITTKETSVKYMIFNDKVLYIMSINTVEKVSGNKNVVIYKGKRLNRYKMCLFP